MNNLHDVFSVGFLVLMIIFIYVLPEGRAKSISLTFLFVLAYVFALAGCTDPEEEPPVVWDYPTDYRVSGVPGASAADVCFAIQEVACDVGDDKCQYNFLNRCVVANVRIEAGSLEEWDQLWFDCLSAAELFGGYRGETQPPPPACVTLTPYWHE